MKMTKEESEYFNAAGALANKILLQMMIELNIPNFVEFGSEWDGFRYTLKLTREKI